MTGRRPPSDRLALPVALIVAAQLLLGAHASAIVFDPFPLPSDPTLADPRVPGCEPNVRVEGQPLVVGVPVVGRTVQIDATRMKLANVDPDCGRYLSPVNDFEWELVARPAGSTAELQNTDTLNPALQIDVVGSYTVRFIACSLSCAFDDPGGTVQVSAASRDVTFQTLNVLPPETVPAVVPSVREPTEPFTRTKESVDTACQGGGGFTDPQWVTVEPSRFVNTAKYAVSRNLNDVVHTRLGLLPAVIGALEGHVVRSRIASTDARSNHYTQDANVDVLVDPIFRAFLFDPEGDDDDERVKETIHNEWETGTYPGGFRPGNGDRASFIGYWIHDCGHDPFRTEIHPPVLVATHRPRAIHIPSDRPIPGLLDSQGQDATVGTNVYVPGILTEVWINPNAGKMTDCVFASGHLSPGSTRLATPATNFGEGACIPAPAPLNALFQFRVYLPRSPKFLLDPDGTLGLPEVPLYVHQIAGSMSEPQVDVVPVVEDGLTYLRVTVDLRDFSAPFGWFTLASAWVYPSELNWGLNRWRVAVDSLKVNWDGDGRYRGKGEWNLWFQIGNGSTETPRSPGTGSAFHEWAKIVDEDVEDECNFGTLGCGATFDFGGRRWSTGNSDPGRSLGPDLLVYPGQSAYLHASGYEMDGSVGSQDSLGLIDERITLRGGNYSVSNACSLAEPSPFDPIFGGSNPSKKSIVEGGCAFYELNYSVENLSLVENAVLSDAAQALMEAYTFGEAPCIPDPDGGGCPPAFPDEVLERLASPAWHPLDAALDPDSDGPIGDYRLFERFEVEENLLAFYDPERLYRETLEGDPVEVNAALAELRELIDTDLETLGQEVLLDVAALRAFLPQKVFARHFGDLPSPKPEPGTSKQRITGAGAVVNTEQRISFELGLHCDPIGGPQKLTVLWGDKRRFDLDLVLDAGCDLADGEMRRHRGRGMGRLDGVPGASVSWIFEDSGEPGRADRARLAVLTGDDEVLVDLDAAIELGNLQAHSK